MFEGFEELNYGFTYKDYLISLNKVEAKGKQKLWEYTIRSNLPFNRSPALGTSGYYRECIEALDAAKREIDIFGEIQL